MPHADPNPTLQPDGFLFPIEDMEWIPEAEAETAQAPKKKGGKASKKKVATLPANLEAERALLGWMLDESVLLEHTPELLKHGGADLFFEPKHREIAEIILHLSDSIRPALPLSIVEAQSENEAWSGKLTVQEITQLQEQRPQENRFALWLEALHQCYVRREMIRLCEANYAASLKGGCNAAEMLQTAEAGLERLWDLTETPQERSMKDLLLESINQIEDSLKHPPQASGLKTGFSDLDYLLEELRPGEVTLLAGAPATGKSVLASNIAEYLAIRSSDPKGIGWWHFQGSAQEITTGLISSLSGVSQQKLRTGLINMTQDFASLTSAAAKLAESRLLIVDSPVLTLGEFRHTCQQWKKQQDIDLIIVDSLQRLVSYTAEEPATITRTLKTLAQELQVHVLVLSGLGGPPPTPEDLDTPSLHVLRNLWPVFDEVDTIGWLTPSGLRTPTALPCRLHILKQRKGLLGRANLLFRPDLLCFQDHFEENYEDWDEDYEDEASSDPPKDPNAPRVDSEGSGDGLSS